MTPPPLAWVPSFVACIERALDCQVTFELKPTVNPLVYAIVLDFSEPLEGKYSVQVWNLFQKFATANDTVPQGKTERSPRRVKYSIIIKRRLGLPKDEMPE